LIAKSSEKVVNRSKILDSDWFRVPFYVDTFTRTTGYD